MPFGLSSTPQVFTKLTGPITAFCHQLGIRIIFYLDNSIIMARLHDIALHHSNSVLSLLAHLDILVNLEKSNLAPAQCFTLLGLLWDSHCGKVALTTGKVARLQSSAKFLLVQPHCSVWTLQKFLGHINFATFAVPRACFHSREIQRVFSHHYNHPSPPIVSDGACCPTQQGRNSSGGWL